VGGSDLQDSAAPPTAADRTLRDLRDRVATSAHLLTGDAWGSLARACASRELQGLSLKDWSDSTAEMVNRYRADWPTISTLAGAFGPEPPAIEDVACDLSDRHRGGRTVHGLSLAGGSSIFYKPRSVGPEVALHEVLHRLGSAGGFDDFMRAPRAIDFGTHGWMEAAGQAASHAAADPDRFFLNAGRLAAVCTVIQLVDLHDENVIAAADQPLVLDAEAILHPPAGRGSVRAARRVLPARQAAMAGESAAARLRRTALPPGSYFDEGGLDASGLSADRERRNCLPGTNAFDSATSVLDGFERMLRWLFANRDALLSGGGAFEPLQGLEARIILRPTAIYRDLMADRGDSPAHDHARRTLLPTERQAIDRWDIPICVHPVTERHELFARSGWDAMRDRLLSGDETEVSRSSAALARMLRRPLSGRASRRALS
jgi:hypothetical protein